jgi:hypothetical protein
MQSVAEHADESDVAVKLGGSTCVLEPVRTADTGDAIVRNDLSGALIWFKPVSLL